MYNRLIKNEKGFTGLEAAIVLIAFVVVAAVFSYVMLGAGFFTTQKSQEVIHSGVTQASSSIAPAGDVIVKCTNASYASDVIFYITNTAGGTAVDLSKTIITYTDKDDFSSEEYSSGNLGWKYTAIVYEPGHNDSLLEAGEKYRIDVTLKKGFASTEPTTNEQIKLEVKPPEGAVLTLTKTMPSALAAGLDYPVF